MKLLIVGLTIWCATSVVGQEVICYETTTYTGLGCHYQPTSIPCIDDTTAGLGEVTADPDYQCGWKKCWIILTCECGPQSMGDICI